MDSHKKEDANKIVAQYIHDKTVIFSDNSTSYLDFEGLVEAHISEKSAP